MSLTYFWTRENSEAASVGRIGVSERSGGVETSEGPGVRTPASA